MKILVYCPLNSDNIEHSLGTADYSYFFVMQRFLPLLESIGEVEILAEPPDDELVARYQQVDKVIYFAFTPPDKAFGSTLCPTVPVFAWEYSTIPYEAFRYPRDNWVEDLRATGQAITHSSFAVDVVREQLGQDYPVVSIPAPLWDACAALREQRSHAASRGFDGIDLNCKIIDSREYNISNTAVRPLAGVVRDSEKSLAKAWSGERLDFSFARGEPGPTLVGFNDAESWGVWSRSGYPWLMLDQTIEGLVEIAVTVRGYAHNIGEPLGIELGERTAYLLLTDDLSTHVLRMQVDSPAHFLAFIGVGKRAVGMDDPRDIGFGLAHLTLRRVQAHSEPVSSVLLDLAEDDKLVLEGFHAREAHGRWTAAPRCSVRLPDTIAGDITVRIETFHSFSNHNREVDLWVGGASGKIVLSEDEHIYEVSLSDVAPTNALRLDNLGLGRSDNPEDDRNLGLGVSKISISISENLEPDVPRRQSLLPAALKRAQSSTDGILYTTILNPNDGRKNWEDIITAFVYALRDRPGATLLVKIANEQLSMFYEDIFTFYMRLHPFKCRIVFIHGYLSDQEYQQLILRSHYIVNASRGEGQCLPLMEFMSSGVPAIAPRNTAMRDYIDPSNAFIVNSSPEIAYWPHDPRQVFRTCWHRINWQTLYDAFVKSETVYRKSPRDYQQMSLSAIAALEKFCSMKVARHRIGQFVSRMREQG
jgi:glycosyltransferase involved in cell wall biosynthesis